jgi:hypothetical protein
MHAHNQAHPRRDYYLVSGLDHDKNLQIEHFIARAGGCLTLSLFLAKAGKTVVRSACGRRPLRISSSSAGASPFAGKATTSVW